MELQVLVATMGQNDFSLIDRMNLRQNVLIANQCGRWGYEELDTESGRVAMLSSDTIGVGVNRNLAIQRAEAEILLFADDDVCYYDAGLEPVIKAFMDIPDADVIFFGIDKMIGGEVVQHSHQTTRRTYLINSLRHGTGRMAIRREAIIKNRLSFSLLFGGGSMYGSGEDTIFIRDCFRAGLRAYTHSYVLGTTAKDSSTWFTGYNEKFLFDKGAFIACAFPSFKHLVKWHFIRRFSTLTSLPLKEVIYWIDQGIKAFPGLKSYDDIVKNQNGGSDHEK